MQKVSRPVLFRLILKQVEADLAKAVWVIGPRGTFGGFRWPATRKRVNKLAREMARQRIREMKHGK